MTAPSPKSMAYRRTVTADGRGYRNISHSATTKFLLKHFAQIGSKNISFYKRITEVSDTHRAFHGFHFGKCLIKMFHSPHGGIRIILNTGNTRFTCIQKNRFYRRRKDNGVGITYFFFHIRTDISQQVHLAQRFASHRHGGKEIQPH